MEKSKHTPAPWVALVQEKHNSHCGISIKTDSRNWKIATVYLDVLDTRFKGLATIQHVNEQSVANAHLIAAAPLIYRELKWCIAALETQKQRGYLDPDQNAVLDASKEAIAKARGES